MYDQQHHCRRFVFHICWVLDEGFEYVRSEHRIPVAKLYILPTGFVLESLNLFKTSETCVLVCVLVFILVFVLVCVCVF